MHRNLLQGLGELRPAPAESRRQHVEAVAVHAADRVLRTHEAALPRQRHQQLGAQPQGGDVERVLRLACRIGGLVAGVAIQRHQPRRLPHVSRTDAVQAGQAADQQRVVQVGGGEAGDDAPRGDIDAAPAGRVRQHELQAARAGTKPHRPEHRRQEGKMHPAIGLLLRPASARHRFAGRRGSLGSPVRPRRKLN